MTLLQSTMLMLTISCALMLVGFSARESRWGPALMMLGIVGEYIGRIFAEVKDRPLYLIGRDSRLETPKYASEEVHS